MIDFQTAPVISCKERGAKCKRQARSDMLKGRLEPMVDVAFDSLRIALRASLNLIRAVARRDSLVRIGVCRGGRSSRFDPRDVCLCRTNSFFFGLTRLV